MIFLNTRWTTYLSALGKPFQKLSRLEFLQPDGSTAFALDNRFKRGYNNRFDSRAFLADGSLSVNLQNGKRRCASVTLSNLDGNFDFAVNRLWFGNRVRLSMGIVLPDGTDFYLPQGVFYLSEPSALWNPSAKTVSFELVDKWSYLDGTLFGTLDSALVLSKTKNDDNVFRAIEKILKFSKFDLAVTETDPARMIDPQNPVFSTYYNGKTYTVSTGETIPVTAFPWDVTIDSENGTLADAILEMNTFVVGICGYDQTGTFRIEPSQEFISDTQKPILFHFSPENSELLGFSENFKIGDVYNDVIIVGEGVDGKSVFGRASNFDPKSDTNINLIGKKTHKERRAEFWNPTQCEDIAKYTLKTKTVLQKSISIRSSQMFHLAENSLISVKRTDKKGNPIEKHIISSISIPIGETGEMTINATSVNDISDFSVSSSKGGGTP